MRNFMRITIPFIVIALTGCGDTDLIYSTGNDKVRTVADDGSGDKLIQEKAKWAAWDEDRSWAVFATNKTLQNGTVFTELKQVRAIGGSAGPLSPQQEQCTSGVACCSIDQPDVSRQGNIVAVQTACNSSTHRIVTMTRDGTNLTLLVPTISPTSSKHLQPRWAANGSDIVFQSGSRVFTVSSTGQDPCEVTSEGREPAWGKLQGKDVIAYIKDGDVHIATPTPTGAGQCPSYPSGQITTNANATTLAWVGSILAVARKASSGSGSDLVLINPLDGSDRQTLANHSSGIFAIDW